MIPLDSNGGYSITSTGVRHKADTTAATRQGEQTTAATCSSTSQAQTGQRTKEQEETREYKPPERALLVGILLIAVCMLATAIIGYIVLTKKQH